MNYNIEIIDVNSEKYPDNLKRIANPPQKLYVIGNVDNLRTNSIAVIGSRICSEKGADTAKNFSYKLSKCRYFSSYWSIRSRWKDNCSIRWRI